MRVIIYADNSFKDYKKLEFHCRQILLNECSVQVVSGGSSVAFAEKFANRHQCTFKEFFSQANVLPSKMAAYADALIAFWDGKDQTTRKMIEAAYAKGVRTRIINV